MSHLRDPAPTRKFKLPPGPNDLPWLWVASGIPCALGIFLSIWGGNVLLGAALVFGANLFLFGTLFVFSRRYTPFLVVGADGVLVRKRFISHAEISSIHRDEQDSPVDSNPSRMCTLSLRLSSGELLYVHPSDVSVMADAIERARTSWLEAQHDHDIDEEIVARGDRTASEWVQELRRLGSNSAAVYRNVVVDADRLSRLLGGARTRPAIRAAAAVVLAASDGATAANRLRIATASLANPRLCAALELIAESKTNIAEVLEALDDEDRERHGQHS